MSSNVLSRKSKRLLCVIILIIALIACSLVITLSSKLYVEAEEVKTYVLTQAGTYSINDANAIVDFSGADTLTDMTFNVGSNVKSIKFISGGTWQKSFKNIHVNSRSTELRMTLENVHIFGGYDKAGINAKDCPKLVLNVIGNNTISAGTVTKKTDKNVGGIICQNIDIVGSGNISIEGSLFNTESSTNNEAGANGMNGQPGLYLNNYRSVVNISAKSVTFKGGNAGLSKKGKDADGIPGTPDQAKTGKEATPGHQGYKGQNGGNGGNGGAGIYSASGTATVNISSGSQVSFFGGNGSNGSDGGNGGKGGIGGEGADAALFVYGTVGGKGGKGGAGGDGGYAGLAGKLFESCKVVGEYTGTIGKAGQTGGKGGKGGEGGEGGLGGWRLDKKYRWASGAKGERGDDGIDRSV